MLDKLRALELVVRIKQEGSIIEAARRMGLSPPTASRILSDFEKDLGALLFHRSTRTVSTTEPGEVFIESAEKILTDYQSARESLAGSHRRPAGKLRVTAPALFGRLFILPIIQDFMNIYQEVTVEAVFIDRVVNVIEEGFDVAVRVGHLPDSSLIARHVGTVRWKVCGSPDYFKRFGKPEHPKDLQNHRLIFTPALSRDSSWVFKDKMSLAIESRLSVSSVLSAIDCAKSGWGLVQALSYQIGDYVQSGALEVVLQNHESDSTNINLLHAQGRTTSAKVQAFSDYAAAELKRNSILKA